MYLIDSSSPLLPGARPSNSSDERILMCASNASGVMTSSAGLSLSAGLSAAKREQEIPNARIQERRNVFITEILRELSTIFIQRVVAVLVSSTELKEQALAAASASTTICFAGTDRRALSSCRRLSRRSFSGTARPIFTDKRRNFAESVFYL